MNKRMPILAALTKSFLRLLTVTVTLARRSIKKMIITQPVSKYAKGPTSLSQYHQFEPKGSFPYPLMTTVSVICKAQLASVIMANM